MSLDVDIKTGKADLKLSSITLDDNKEFRCQVQIPNDDEGKLAGTTRLVVLGNFSKKSFSKVGEERCVSISFLVSACMSVEHYCYLRS